MRQWRGSRRSRSPDAPQARSIRIFKDWTVLKRGKRGATEMLNGLRFKPALIGEGILNHKAVLKAMQQAHYGGVLTSSMKGTPIPTSHPKAVAYLRTVEMKRDRN